MKGGNILPLEFYKNNTIKNPVNKSISGTSKLKYSKGQYKRSNFRPNGVSIITCTNRLDYMENILNNYKSQIYNSKELIIVLNKNSLELERWKDYFKDIEEFKIFKLDENISLGECLNFGIKESEYNIIAKFDDDDYYSPKYLSESIKAFEYTDADVIGKSTTYVYFKKNKKLAIRNPRRENKYVYRVEGPTLIMKKRIFDKIKFSNKSLGEDVQFCKDCYDNGIKIYSTDKYNHVYIRHGSTHNHTWGITDDYYMKLCDVIGKIENYKNYVTK